MLLPWHIFLREYEIQGFNKFSTVRIMFFILGAQGQFAFGSKFNQYLFTKAAYR